MLGSGRIQAKSSSFTSYQIILLFYDVCTSPPLLSFSSSPLLLRSTSDRHSENMTACFCWNIEFGTRPLHELHY